MEKITLFKKTIAHRTLRVDIGPHDGRIVVSIGQHHERDGRGVWLNVDARDLSELVGALQIAREMADGKIG